MRIAVAHSFYRVPGGEDSYVRTLESLLADHEVLMLTRDNRELSSAVAAAKVMTFSASSRRAAIDALRHFDPDVIHLHNPYPSWGPALHLAARKLRVPLVLTVHNYRLRCPNGYMFTEGSVCRRCVGGNHLNAIVHDCFPKRSQAISYATALWLHRFVFRIERDITAMITPSTFMRDEVVSWGVPARKVRVIRNFCDSDERADAAPGRYGLYAGRLSFEKGLDVLLDALKLAGDPPFRIAGDGPLRDAITSRRESLGLQNTEVLGRLDRESLRAAMRGARYVAFPSSWNENAPIAAAEAFAAGRPLLVTDRGGLPELAGGGRGLTVPAGDPPAMAAAIRAMHDEFDCAAAGEKALAFHRAELTPDAHRVALELVLSEARGSRAG